MTRPIGYHPLVIPHPRGGWIATAVEIWGAVNAGLCAQEITPDESDAHTRAARIAAEAQTRRDAAHEADLGEIMQTFTNGWQLRRKVGKLMGPDSVQIGLVDPNTPEGQGPWRGSAHNQWSSRDGAPRWRVSIIAVGGPKSGTLKTEAGAAAHLIRTAEAAYGVKLTPVPTTPAAEA